MTDPTHFQIERALNNNVLVVHAEDGSESILVGKGIGFGVRKGSRIGVTDPRIEKRFALVSEENRARFRQLYTIVSAEVIGVAEEIIANTVKALGQPLREHIHVALPDHIGFALTRLRGGLEIDNPFLEEIQTLYPAYWQHAAEGAKLIEKRFNVQIPQSEIGFLTLHLHAAAHQQGLSETVRVTHGVKAALTRLEALLAHPLARDRLEFARFITHLRFAIVRVLKGESIVNPLTSAIRDRLPHSWRIAEEVAGTVEDTLNIHISEDEVAYLSLHVARISGERDARSID